MNIMNNIGEWFLSAIEKHDGQTYAHCRSVAKYSMLLGKSMGLSQEDLDMLYWNSLLHDVGKLAVPKAVLQKPTELTDEELAIIRKHPIIGAIKLENAIPNSPYPFDGVQYHHERYDGTGYPSNKRGRSIPFIARIIAIADVYEALTSPRPYRSALPERIAVSYLLDNRGSYFDPALATLFVAALSDKPQPEDMTAVR